MKQTITNLTFQVLFLSSIFCQTPSLTYYLPDITYDSNIPTPEDVLGFMPGEWHISHDQIVRYMYELAEASDRVTIEEYARSYEHRPLILLTITSPKNHADIDNIRRQHVSLTNPNLSAKLDISKMPIVIYQGFSIHGNEPSGGNASVLAAYYLAAGQSKEVTDILDNTIVLLDPIYNPDGFHRFSTWANMHKNLNLTDDPQDREYTEVWPRGRTNHYWFDLNRDWLPTQHPESQGRIRNFHKWKPNILTDHHEMGSNNTFFFQPGIPTRTNPLTPNENQELTYEIGTYHAANLDKIGSLYYSQESFDDYYYGKGSTYPDVNGGVGILFEQGSSRGHLQATSNGQLSFPFTIRNQVATALSTQTAAVKMRTKMLDYQRRFYYTAMEEARKDNAKAYVFTEPNDGTRLAEFLDLMLRHQIEVYQLKNVVKTEVKTFKKDNSSFIIPLEQPQYRLIKGMFEKVTQFQDSLFYDVSAWTLPLSYDIDYARLNKSEFSGNLVGSKVTETVSYRSAPIPAKSNYAYLFEWDEYLAPKALYYLMKNGLRTKVASNTFQSAGRDFDRGTILIPIQNQGKNTDEIHELIKTASAKSGVTIFTAETGSTEVGIDLGSPRFSTLKMPKVLLLVGGRVSSYDAGEVWHLLDQRYHIPISMIETDDIGGKNLDKYNVIVMVGGSYGNISNSGVEKIKEWVKAGGTLIPMKDAVNWAKSKGLAKVEFITSKNNKRGKRPYAKLSPDNGAQVIGGAIFETKIDLTHPLFYGYNDEYLPVFRRGTLFFKPSKNAYATPSIYTNDPLLSGYISSKNSQSIRNSAGVIVSGTGSGKTICLADNPNFRAFWYGTNKLFANAIFFGNTISSRSIERANGLESNRPSREEEHGHQH
ncbi:M14 family zinc carboxypeptidase [Saprospiraceae bacterium]|nr:M14 family zinc carboxypeptidase [Bacteroidota bacterium]MDB4727237.1 M14 family zinc carboxypeptidase [Saprospiraceae bacterium]